MLSYTYLLLIAFQSTFTLILFYEVWQEEKILISIGQMWELKPPNLKLPPLYTDRSRIDNNNANNPNKWRLCHMQEMMQRASRALFYLHNIPVM